MRGNADFYDCYDLRGILNPKSQNPEIAKSQNPEIIIDHNNHANQRSSLPTL
jgi:hypothetical protein